MANTWKPKSKVLCSGCGWAGIRAATRKACPRCGHWYPKPVEGGERPPAVFVPHSACTVPSGDCFTAGRCLDQCKAQAKKQLLERVRELEGRVRQLEQVIYRLRLHDQAAVHPVSKKGGRSGVDS